MKISREEAIRRIESDQTDMMVAYGHFLQGKDFPFNPPKHYERNIIIWPPADVHPAAELGDGVIIGRYTNICGNIKIGEKTRIQGFCFIPDCVEIGARVFIGPGVIFTNVKYPQARTDRFRHRDGKIVIEDGASIGAGVIICPNVKIGSNALIGAGAVVTKNVPKDYIMVGIPAIQYKRGKK